MTRLKLLCSGAISTCTWGSLFGSRRRWPQEKNYTYAWLLDLETAAILMKGSSEWSIYTSLSVGWPINKSLFFV
jgi:hypothetical protein